MSEALPPPPPPIPPDPAPPSPILPVSAPPSSVSPSRVQLSFPIDVEMSDLSSSSSPPLVNLKSHDIPSERGVLGVAPSSFLARDSAYVLPSVPIESSSPSVVSPTSRVSNPTAGVLGAGFNWAKNLTSSGKIPISSAPVSISTEGRPRVKVPNAVFERGAKLHEDYIVGVFYGKAPSYGKIWGVLNFLWGKDKRVTVHNLTNNAFLFYIPSPSLRKRVLQHELWRVGDSPFFVMPWTSEFTFNPPSLDRAPVWASIKNIPFDLITPEGLSIICRPLGRAVDYKPFNSINSAEVKVVVDLTKPLPNVLELEQEDGHILLLTVTFPWLPPLCSICNEIGHKSVLCPNAPPAGHQSSNSRSENLPSKSPVSKQPGSSLAEPKKVWIQVQGKNVSEVVHNVDTTAPSALVTSNTQAHPPVSHSMPQSSADLLVTSVTDDPVKVQKVNLVTGQLPPSEAGLVSSFSENLAPSHSRSETPFVLASHTVSPSTLALATIPPPSTSNPFDMLQEAESDMVLVAAALSPANSGLPSSSSTFSEKKKKKRKWDAQHSPPHGGVLSILGEKPPTRARVLFKDLQSITCEITLEDGTNFVYTAVYAANEEEDRQSLWASLRNLASSFCLSSRPWMINGDFNEILHPAETSNPNIVSSTRGMRLFGECLADLGVFDLPSRGPKFTWTNKRSLDPIGKKIDRCLVNGTWLLRFPLSHCTFEAPEFSDHTPCHIKLVTDPPAYGTRPFKFFNFLAKHPLFLDSVKEVWESVGGSVFALKDFCFKLKKLKQPLKSLLKNNFSDLEKRVLEAHSTLKSLQLISFNDPSPLNLQNESSAKDIWSGLCLTEESFFRQKSRIRWMGEGDLNTSFFHSVTTARNAGNAIRHLLKPDGSYTSSLQEVHELAVNHFSGILTTIKGQYCPALPGFLNFLIHSTCSDVQQEALFSTFTGEDIRSCLFKMPLNKTPGPDGFSVEFFKSTWSIIGQDLITVVLKFFQDSFIPTALNSTSLVLIPKRPGSEELKDFRPISCLNTVYKIISRLLTNRLKPILPDLILPNQTAFVKDRLLLENVLLASEVMQGYHLNSRKARITLKVDIAKAFDSAAEMGSFGYHLGCEELKLTHLCFADDLLIFLDGTENSLRGVLSVLADFERMSGLSMNVEKTSLFCSGLGERDLQHLTNVFHLKHVSLPVRYLGLPLSSRKLSVKDCDPLLYQIRKKLNSWTHRFLSFAGRLTLLSSVISGIIGFWTSAFFLPKRVSRKINSLCSSFLWHGKAGIASGAKVAWHDICFPKKEGGLGLRHIGSWIETCALKLIWMLFFRAGSLWVAWIREKYLSLSSFWALNANNYAYSWIFRRLLKLRPKALKFLSIKIGNGDSTFFWWDPWTPYGSLYHFLGADGPSRLGIPLLSTVAEVWNVDGWSLPNARTARQVLLYAFISTVTFSSSSDKAMWAVNGLPCRSFSSKDVWNSIRDSRDLCSWAPLVWHKAVIPKHATTTWIFILNRNPTLDRMASWGYDIERDCLLCGLAQETRNHLFFECSFSAQVWSLITQKLGILSPPTIWDQVLLWLPNALPTKYSKLAVLHGWQGVIYELWRERNRRYHDGLTLLPSTVANLVISTIENKCTALHQLGSKSALPILQCWMRTRKMLQDDDDAMPCSKNVLLGDDWVDDEDDDDDTFSGIGDSFEYDTVNGSDEDYEDPPAVTSNLKMESAIYVGQEFQSKAELQQRLNMLKLEEEFNFRVHKSEPSLLVVKCAGPAGDVSCQWMVRASKLVSTCEHFTVRKHISVHTCSLESRKPGRVTAKFISQLFRNERGEDGHNSKPNDISTMMLIKYGFEMKYWNSWKSLEHVKESVRGTAESGYERLPAYIHLIKKYNPGTIAHLEKDGEDRFKYLFISFGACVKGFKFMRKVIVVDGSFLKGKYEGLLLVATAQDGNYQIFPIAFGIVDSENNAAWEWFFNRLQEVIPDSHDLVIISDRHQSIAKAITKVYPAARRGICTYHLKKNIMKKFRGSEHMSKVKEAANAYSLPEFAKVFGEIRQQNARLCNYLEKAGVTLWSRAHFSGNRYNVTTSNIAESINGALKKARELPIVTFLEYVGDMLSRWFYERRVAAALYEANITPRVDKMMNKRSIIGKHLKARPINTYRFQLPEKHLCHGNLL
ncbi:Zinc finger PMZ-type [Arabidopsis thaliana x Arabidopsis arenosa]|uniref:Zinc finger PMZ-type n=1 Tax=Arabidopsis thaliana x Arabidopsis arenosa TaxID=1240361 RepID=A0A8T1XIS3_9BRAS|nr:Zinc finger PMZ-type [Arabidopsis thaliana x Arabidopsis arenosa]